jgi:glycosyltransferase involved in cell wall biosynthesis
VEPYIRLTGHLEHPFPVMQQADVVLMCSSHEALGRVTIEAMRAAKPVVGARCAGTVELIREGFNGLTYAAGDAAELAEKIRYLHDHPDHARRMGANGQQWAAARFTEAQYGEGVLRVLNRCLASPEDQVPDHRPIEL